MMTSCGQGDNCPGAAKSIHLSDGWFLGSLLIPSSPQMKELKEHSFETALHRLPFCLCLGKLTLLRSSDFEKFIRPLWTPFLF